jgi:flagellar export protein FliJ
MGTMQTLERLAKRRLDHLALEMVAARGESDRLRVALAALFAREQSEMTVAAGDFLLAPTLLAYRERVRDEAARLQYAIDQKEQHIERLRSDIADAFGEKARLETLIARTAARAAADASAREQAALDEGAVLRAARERD